MKKLAVLALVGLSVLVYTLPLYAADIKFNGDFRVRGFYLNNVLDTDYGNNDEQAFADLRFRLRTKIKAGITTGVVTLDLANGYGGTDVSTFNTTPGAGGTGDTRFGSIGFGRSHNVVGIREAYLKLDLTLAELNAGRKQLKLGHGIILDDTMDLVSISSMQGPLNLLVADAKLCDSQAGPFSAVPGGTATNPGFAVPNVFGGCPLSNPPFAGSTNTTTGGDTDLYVFAADFTHEHEHQIGLFVTYLNDRSASTFGTYIAPGVVGVGGPGTAKWGELLTFGLTADGKFGPMNLNFEFDGLTGTVDTFTAGKLNANGYNAFAGVGMDAGKAKVNVAAVYASGQNGNSTHVNVNDLSPNFVLGNILINNDHNSDRDGGTLNPTGSGLFGIKVGAGLNPMQHLGVDFALIWAETSMTPVPSGAVPNPSRNLGYELDANAHLNMDENTTLFAGLGYLIAGQGWQAVYGNPNAGDDAFKMNMGISYLF